jgi:hypothetical protein
MPASAPSAPSSSGGAIGSSPTPPNGAHASAALYSIIETAKANGHEPYRYLRFLFTELPKAQSPEAIAALLSFNIAPEDLPQP